MIKLAFCKKTAYLSEEISLVTLAFEYGKTADE